VEIDKSYYRSKCELPQGEGTVITEFYGEVATRQITIFNGIMYSSSSLEDWDENVGYLLYDGKKNELDLQESEVIDEMQFEYEWDKTISDSVVNSYISYQTGDATIPISSSRLIIHIVNNMGKWGKGFVVALSKRYPVVKKMYQDWVNDDKSFALGNVQFVVVDEVENVFVANMLAQNGIKRNYKDSTQYISYEHLEKCLSLVADFALEKRLSIQLPMIGAGLGGGDWNVIEKVIKNKIARNKIKCDILRL